MQSAFGIVIFVVVALAAVVAIVSLVNRSDVYDQIGRGGLSLNEDRGRGHPEPPGGSAVARAQAEEEVRQMVSARSERLVRRGEPALDVEAEVARLLSPASTTATADPELVSEIRQLVLARNARRARQGKPPLDVEAEVRRQLRDLSG